MKDKTRIHAQLCNFNKSIDLFVAQELPGGGTAVGKPITMETINQGMMAMPTLTIPHGVGQALMDDLWLCGIRPTDGTGSAGSLLATEKHLNDMRAIVGKKLQVELR